MTSELTCAVVIPTRQRPVELARTIESILQCSPASDEIIVVSDGDNPSMHACIDSLPLNSRVKLIFTPESRGQAAARNEGAATAVSDVLLFVDDDMTVDGTLIESHMSMFEEERTCDKLVVCGTILEEYGSAAVSTIERYLRRRRDVTLEQVRQAITSQSLRLRSYACCGVNCSVRRDFFLSSGGFDESLRVGGEDTELGFRLLEKGAQFRSAPLAVVHHHDRTSIKQRFLSGNRAAGIRHVEQARNSTLTFDAASRLAKAAHPARLRQAAEKLYRRAPALEPRLETFLEKTAEVCHIERIAAMWSSVAGSARYEEGLLAAGETPSSAARHVNRGPAVALLHSISSLPDNLEDMLATDEHRFIEFLDQLDELGVKPMALGDALDNRGRVALTFDDAYEDFFEVALPALEERAHSATVFAVAGLVGGTNDWDSAKPIPVRRLMSARQLRDAASRGVEIGSHTMTHPWLPVLDSHKLTAELSDSRKLLEDMLGQRVRGFAYPSGGIDMRVRQAVMDAGYEYAVTTIGGANNPLDRFAIERRELHASTRLRKFVRTLAKDLDLARRHSFSPAS